MDLDECIKKGLLKRTKTSRELVLSLIEMSDVKEDVVKNSRINQKNVSVFVSLAYDSLREILEAICILRGYKVMSHACIGVVVKRLIKEFDLSSFDRFRYIRNSINYYGTKVDFNQGKDLIKKILEMKNLMKNKLKNMMKKG